MQRKTIVGILSLALIASVSILGCGGSSTTNGSTATQYTLDVQATMTISPVAAAQTVSKIQEQQVMIGTMLIEVSTDTAQELGVDFLNWDLEPQTPGTVNIQFQLNPQLISTGIIFKTCDLGVPFGTSYLDFALAATSQSNITFQETGTNVLINDGQTLTIGGLIRAEADANDRSRLPVLGDIPVINFLFQGEQHQAQLSDLIIILTPQILDDTHG